MEKHEEEGHDKLIAALVEAYKGTKDKHSPELHRNLGPLINRLSRTTLDELAGKIDARGTELLSFNPEAENPYFGLANTLRFSFGGGGGS